MNITLDAEGRLQLPGEIQQQLGVKPGDDVILEEHAGQLILRAKTSPSGLGWKGNVLVHQGVSAIPSETALSEIRDQRLEQLSEGIPG